MRARSQTQTVACVFLGDLRAIEQTEVAMGEDSINRTAGHMSTM